MAARVATRSGAVATRPRGIHARSAGTRATAPTFPIGRDRVAYLDNLKVLLVAVIIAAHGVLGYSGLKGAWPYQAVREVRLSAVSDAVIGILVSLPMLFAMGLFFLISGLVTPGSLARHGPRAFARARLTRLGIPLAVWALGIWPALIYAVHQAAGERHSYWWQFMHHGPFLEPGPMWFVEVLLMYSLGYAAWRQWRRQHAAPFARLSCSAADRPPSSPGPTLLAIAAGVSLATILVRPLFPFLSGQIGQLKLWQWPQYLAMFGLGTVAARHHWLDPVPDHIRRQCAVAVAVASIAGVAVFLTVILTGLKPAVFGSRLHWAPTCLAAIEGPIAVGASVWLLAAAQRHLNHPAHPRARALSRSAFTAFILQGPVLIGLALALRPLGLPAELKALAVACLGVSGSFALAWILITRTPLSRIL